MPASAISPPAPSSIKTQQTKINSRIRVRSRRCFHVGRRIKSKCLAVSPSTCNSAGMAKVLAMAWVQQIQAIDALERAKPYPHRYPVNGDSIGIELVGKSVDPKKYESVTPLQSRYKIARFNG